MDRKLKPFLAFVVLLSLAFLGMQQMNNMAGILSTPPVAAGITLDASCTGSGTANPVSCSAPMTVTAGDTITCNVVGVSGGSNETGTAMDSVNGYYEAVNGLQHISNSLSWATTAVKQNSAGGSITPQMAFSAWPLSRGVISCYAWKGTATANALDGGTVNQTASASVINPTSGSVAAPTNNNEVVVAFMSRNNSTAPSSGGGSWLPAGTLTVVGGTGMRQESEYQIQTTATAVNGPFTGNTTAQNTVDTQLAILPNGTTGGYRSLTGVYVPLGAAGSAQTGSISAAMMGTTPGNVLSSIHYNTVTPFWTLNGTAPTFDTSVVPTGTGTIMVQGVPHSFGDSGSSMLSAGASATSNFSTLDMTPGMGTPHWMSLFFRLASGGTTNQPCDDWYMQGAVTEGQMIVQTNYATGTNYSVHLEGNANEASQASATLTTDTDYWMQLHLAGVNERNHEFLVYTKSGAVWSLASTLTMDVLCSNGANASCSTPAAQATTTGTASSGSTALTVASGTGIVLGQVVLGTGIPDPSQGGAAWTVVAAVSGTSVTLSQNTSGALSGTTVKFYTKPAGFIAGTNGSVTVGSSALSVVTPGTGTIAVGQSVGGAGIVQGTIVTAVSLPSVTLSIPANATMTNGGVSFWTTPSNGGLTFGKNSGGSCSINSNQWFSGVTYDPYGTWGAFAPN